MADRRDPREKPYSASTSRPARETARRDDEIIELTEVVDPRGEEIIELTEVVAPPPDGVRGEIIELTEVVSGPGGVARDPGTAKAPPAPVAPPPGEEEDLFDLGVAIPDAEESSAPPAAQEETTEEKLYFSIADLPDEALDSDAATPRGGDSLALDLEADLGVITDEDLDFNLSTQELSEAIDMLDTELKEGRAAPPAEPRHHPLQDALTPERLEAALEKVVRKLYAEKIDRLLDEAIQRTVSKEIQHLRRQLLDSEGEER